jgi:hypothetical protein
MNLRTLLLTVVYSACGIMVVACVVQSARSKGDLELAHHLAEKESRANAVAGILASGAGNLPLLISWTRTPPAGIDRYELNIGLADAFGSLKAKEAIPFLIENISRRRDPHLDLQPWLRGGGTIERTFPSVAALIQIGPDASRELIRASAKPMLAEDRLAAVFVVSRIKDVPEALPFLRLTRVESNLTLNHAEIGIKLLEGNAQAER